MQLGRTIREAVMSNAEIFAREMDCTLADLESFRQSSGGIGLEEFLANKRPISDIVHFGEKTLGSAPKRRRLDIPLPRKECGTLPDEAELLRIVPMAATTVSAPQQKRAPTAKRRLKFAPPPPAPPNAEELLPPIAWTADLLDITTPVSNYSFTEGFSMFREREREAERADSADSDDELVAGPRITDREKKTPAFTQWLERARRMNISVGPDLPRLLRKPRFGDDFCTFRAPDLSGVFDGTFSAESAKVVLPIALCAEPPPTEKFQPLGIGSVRIARHKREDDIARHRERVRNSTNMFSGELLGEDYPTFKKRQSVAFGDMLAYTVAAPKPGKAAAVRDAVEFEYTCLVQHDEISPALGSAGTLSEFHIFEGRQPSSAFAEVPWSKRHCHGSPLAVPGACNHPIGVIINEMGRCAVAPAKEGEEDELFVVSVCRKTGLVRRASPVTRRYAAGQWFPKWPQTDKETERWLQQEYNNRIIRALWPKNVYRPSTRAALEALIPPHLPPKRGHEILRLLTRDGNYIFSQGPPTILPVHPRITAALKAHANFLAWEADPSTSIFDDRRAVDPFVAGPVLADHLRDKCILIGGGPGAACVASVNLAWRFSKKSGVVQAANDRVVPRIDHPNGHYPPIKPKKARVNTSKDRRRSTDEELNAMSAKIVRTSKTTPTVQSIRKILVERQRYASQKKKTPGVKLSKTELQRLVSQKWKLHELLKTWEMENDPTDGLSQIALRIYSFKEHCGQRVDMKNCWLYSFSLTARRLTLSAKEDFQDRYKFPKPKKIALKTLEAKRPDFIESVKWTRYRKGDLPPYIIDTRYQSIVDGTVVDVPAVPNSADVWAVALVSTFAVLVQLTQYAQNASASEQKEYFKQRDVELERFRRRFHPPCISEALMKQLVARIVEGKRW